MSFKEVSNDSSYREPLTNYQFHHLPFGSFKHYRKDPPWCSGNGGCFRILKCSSTRRSSWTQESGWQIRLSTEAVTAILRRWILSRGGARVNISTTRAWHLRGQLRETPRRFATQNYVALSVSASCAGVEWRRVSQATRSRSNSRERSCLIASEIGGRAKTPLPADLGGHCCSIALSSADGWRLCTTRWSCGRGVRAELYAVKNGCKFVVTIVRSAIGCWTIIFFCLRFTFPCPSSFAE